MRFFNHIFDIGAFNGLDGIILALKNKNVMVHAFEANPDLIKIISENKKKIEKYKNTKIKNYRINNYAISNMNKSLYFNIAKNPTVSSLHQFSKDLDKYWPGYREPHCTFVKKIKVKGITLEKYCKDNNINNISYIHIDTQGNDLNVLKGLKNKINIVDKGVLEAAVNKKNSMYRNSHTISEVQKFLKKNKFKVSKITSAEKNISNEKNIFFQKITMTSNNDIKTRYNLKHFERIISNKTYFFDYLINKIENWI